MKKITVLLLLILISLGAFADDAHGTIEPSLGGFSIQNCDSIEMTDETVEIWENRVKVTFHFKNLSSQKQTVTIGFPVKWYEETGVSADENRLKDDEQTKSAIEKYYNFRSRCNGKKLERKLIASANQYGSFDFWFTTELVFAPGQVLEVVDEYNAGYSYGSDSIGWSWKTWSYILSTGSSWANNIKKATIIFHSKYKYQWKKYYVSEIAGEKNYIWDIDSMSYHWGSFSHAPKSIKYDKTKKETVITWILENIKPQKEWEAETITSAIHSPDNWKQEFAYDLVKDELFKIPGYTNGSRWWFDDEYREDSDRTWIYEELGEKEKFYAWVKELYESGFTEFQAKTKVAGVYAQLLINSIYAMHGYQFKNEKWSDTFSRFLWYKPVTSSLSEKDFTAEENSMIKRLKKFR